MGWYPFRRPVFVDLHTPTMHGFIPCLIVRHFIQNSTPTAPGVSKLTKSRVFQRPNTENLTCMTSYFISYDLITYQSSSIKAISIPYLIVRHFIINSKPTVLGISKLTKSRIFQRPNTENLTCMTSYFISYDLITYLSSSMPGSSRSL